MNSDRANTLNCPSSHTLSILTLFRFFQQRIDSLNFVFQFWVSNYRHDRQVETLVDRMIRF